MRAVSFALFAVLTAFSARASQAQQAQWPRSVSTDSTAVTLGLMQISRVFPFKVSASPATDAYFMRVPFTSWVSNWENRLRSTLEQERYAFLRPSWSNVLANKELPVEVAVAPTIAAPDTAGRGNGILSGKIGQYAEIGMSVQGRGEMGGSWNRYSPCDPGIQLTCNPSLFPQLRPDMQFGLRVAGTISDRVHVDVDYDQRREFDAANNINVYYQGMEDEILQRVEVGDVSIRLPTSRYLTQGIPTGNFGFKATGQVGPLEFQTVFAQQRGDVSSRQFQLGGLGASQGLVQDAELVRDDADYVKGQFFFLVSPDSLRGTPSIDVLALQAGDAPASLRPAAGGSIQVYRDERITLTNPQQQAQLQYFRADAVNGNIRQAGLFRRLLPEDGYIVHSSGLWIMLRSPLRADESLAISYVTERGDTVGTLNADKTTAGPTPVLKLLRGPVSTHQPGAPSWDYELHQAYLIDNSNNVDLSTIDLRVSLGDITGGRTFRQVRGQNVSLLRLFGLDEDSPVDLLDNAQIYQPGRDPFGAGTGALTPRAITGTYVIFPALRPFQKPGPLNSIRLSAAEVQTEIGNDRNDVIYDNPDPVTREGGGRYRLNFKFRQKVEGVISTFNLGAFGIRETSERLFLGDKQLTAGVDYNIDYDLGQVTLTDAATLFGANPGAQIRATWEQKSLFQIAPTSVFGLNTRYGLGKRGELNFVTLYQSEKSIMSRPQIGAEPGSILLGGASARFDLGGYFLDRALANIPGLHVSMPSAVTLTGELAFSAPNPNTRGAAFLDDFEATEETQIATSRRFWRLGSRPQSPEQAEAVLPVPLDATTAAQLVWQHDPLNATGQSAGLFRPRDIDHLISVAGNQVPEAVLWLTFGDTVPNTIGKRWRSMTTVLSTTGRDMTRSEYLEFYLWGPPVIRGQTMVVDIGAVSEDGFYYDQNRQTNGIYEDGQKWGLGEFDQEARLANGEIFGPDKDARGLWNAPCEANLQQVYVLGSPNANCARKNGEPDTEDLNGDGILDANDGAYFRFVIPIDDTSPYLARDKAATGTDFRLFRIPLRTAGHPVNGASDATWRFVKHLRMTLVSTPTATDKQQNFVIARPRIIGARWTKRDVFGISHGLVSDQTAPSGSADNLEVGPVSRLADANYVSPDGVSDQLQDPSQRFGSAGIEFNEKSLRLKYNRLGPDERAEVYYRYPQQSRAFLNYRQLRLWVLARNGAWGPNGSMQFLVKAGNDPRNYYLYRAKLAAPHSGAVVPGDWLPEVTIDFNQWMALRVDAEARANSSSATPGQPIVVWNADSTYAVVMEDRARAPNLSAMRELSFAIYNGGSGFADGEVWIDDMRVSDSFKDPGAAGTVSLDIRGGDFLSANLTYANQGAVFRQLNQDPRYQRAGDFSLSATAQLGQMLPSGWGVDMPVSVVHTTSQLDPTFLTGTDIRAQQLQGLRTTGADATRVSVSLRKRTPAANPLVGLLVDGVNLRFGYNTAGNNSITSTNDASGVDAGLTYARDLKPRTIDAVPSIFEGALKALAPGRVEQSDFFKRLSGARFRWNPERLSMGSAYYGQERRAYQFTNILALPSDTLPTPIESPRKGLENDAFITFAPFSGLRATFSARSSRDLLEAERASRDSLQRSAINAARGQLGGLDVGWETNRSLGSELSFRPDISPWLRPVFTWSTRYGTDRNTSYLEINPADSTAAMQRRFQADRTITKGLLLEPSGMVNALLGMPATVSDSILRQHSALARLARRSLTAVQPVEVNWNSTLGSQFERERFVPGLGYQFGFGNFNGYRLIGGDTAVFVNGRDVFSARSGIALPFASVLTTTYEETTLDAIDQRGGHRSQLDRTWPNVQLAVPRLPLPKFINNVVTNSVFNVGFQRTKQESLLGGLTGQDRTGNETRFPVSLTLAFQRGLAARYSGSFTSGESTDPTGNAENASTTHDVSFSGFIQVPESMKQRLQQPIQLTLAFRQQGQRQCRFRDVTSADETVTQCVPFIDFRNRSLNLVLESRVSDLTVGFNMAYTSRQSFVGTHSGSSQFQLGFSGQFNLKAGRDLGGGDGVR